MRERVQKILSACGVASRREAEKMIVAGRVRVNGKIISLGDSADSETDEITVDGHTLTRSQERVYIMLNKPRGYITSVKDDRGRKTVCDCLSDAPVRVYPVGRLDYDSEGLLLMTNDGGFTHKMTHPSNGVLKTYVASVRGDIDAALPRLSAPLRLDDGAVVRAVRAVRHGENAVSITIAEGRNRQIRRMCAVCGLEVRRLVRVSIGSLTLGSLRPGQWRYLTPRELKTLL